MLVLFPSPEDIKCERVFVQQVGIASVHVPASVGGGGRYVGVVCRPSVSLRWFGVEVVLVV
mgnify:CR=1 FL=1